MGLVELFVAVLLVGISCVNAAPPAVAWSRARDGRFLFLVAANLAWAALGSVWVWGELPWNLPSWSHAQLPVLLIALVAAGLFLVTTLWPRRS